jgi:hypothetical protein
MQVFGQSPMLLKYSLKHEIAKKMKVTIVAYCGGQSTCFSVSIYPRFSLGEHGVLLSAIAIT